MKPTDFHFDLPDELIAHYPADKRSDSRLLCMERKSGKLEHRSFSDLPTMLKPDDLLVFNNTRVIPGRLFGYKSTGGRIEVLLERVLTETEVLAQIRSNRPPAIGGDLYFIDTDDTRVQARIAGREEDFYKLRFEEGFDLMALLDRIGHIPLPPYIKREDSPVDEERYQTVYASKPGAIAAPTAGLHFDEGLLDEIRAMGIDMAYVTLHVGAGTFQPIRVNNVSLHRMHAEYLEVSEEACQAVRNCRERGGRIIAVGTTSVRCLETAGASGKIMPYRDDTRIFIYPGYRFRFTDALITNFHLPESTLIMLVSAFSSREHVLNAYEEAVKLKYRFFSYGDAMFIS